ncbi:MAG: hypothetical protein L3J87_05250, partial [Thermoplasmata archaeon]|nr:hypothetical protein [Thermoplasmata archaeon]
DFGDFSEVADIGGGHGALLAELLARHPRVRGTLFDLPEVVAGAPPLLRARGVEERCSVVGGSFFAEVPSGADAYVLRCILHDWPDAEATRILRTVRSAAGPSSKLLVIDEEVPATLAPHLSKLLDLNMMISLGGRERTRAEMGGLFAEAGFRLRRVLPAGGLHAIFEGEPVAPRERSVGNGTIEPTR